MYIFTTNLYLYIDMNNEESRVTNRRTILQLATLAGGFGLVPSAGAASGTSDKSGAGRMSDGVVLGNFESNLDGWTTTGNNELTRAEEEAFPAGITSGGHGLVVEINGDTSPMIQNSRRVRDADFANNPYLRMDVLAAAEETDSALAFTFRLHHASANGGRGTSGQSSRGDGPVEESETKMVSQLRPQTVQWDMSGLSDETLRTAKRLEIVCIPRNMNWGVTTMGNRTVRSSIRDWSCSTISGSPRHHQLARKARNSV